ncbi:MAG: hypothetical protein IT450_00695 [Phycisphaerales bacterium]|nr:hypothetical protein [Phycisphaerales bacterium]
MLIADVSKPLRRWSRPTIETADALVFGRAPSPVRCGLDLEIGAGVVHPEINFTLPPMLITPATWPDVCEIYDRTLRDLLARARDLRLPGLMVEFEHLPPMTAMPGWGAELTRRMKTQLEAAHADWGLAAALRATVVDLRDETHPPQRRSGHAWQSMLASFGQNAAAGADVLSIESTGGKEVHDIALPRGDLAGIVLALGVLAPRDMHWLWGEIIGVANSHSIIGGGDSACGFANTAMQLAGQHMLPDCLAALVRAMSAVRSLGAFECGAVGPSKDCAYENPVLKAITGCPISMEGRSAACAHLSPLGNIAAAAADLWSNESVPDVRLLSGPAPVASLESLAYDCRLMNTATARGQQLALRDLHVASDAPHACQAALLTPEVSIALARAIAAETDSYRQTLAAGRVALDSLAQRAASGGLVLPAGERRWLDRLRRDFDKLPGDGETLIHQTRGHYGSIYDAGQYGLES